MRTRLLRWSTVITGGILFGGLGGNCLPDNLIVNTIGDIVGDVAFRSPPHSPLLVRCEDRWLKLCEREERDVTTKAQRHEDAQGRFLISLVTLWLSG